MTAPLSLATVATAHDIIPSNNPPLQTLLGAATLSLLGHAPAAPLSATAYLKAGDHLGCWLLVADDPFRHIPAKPSPLPDPKSRPDEYKAVSQILLQVSQDDPAALRASAVANEGVTYAMLRTQPDVHRGKIVHVEGNAQWMRKLDTPPLLKDAGLDALYEVWILNHLAGDTPYCVLLTRLPADLPLDRRLNVRVALDGYFLKYRKEAVPFKAWTDSLLVAAHSLTVLPIPLNVTAGGRRTVGGATLLLNGASLSPMAAVEELALLQAGDDAGCWTLVNGEVVRPLRKETLAKISDGKTLPADANDGREFDALLDVLVQTWQTSPQAFEKTARRDLSFAQLFHEPARYRGEVVHIEGRLRLVQRWDPPVMARDAGVPVMYEAAIFDDASGGNPYIVFVMEPPDGVPLNQKVSETATFDGYFYKKWRYKALDTVESGKDREAPLLIGRSLKVRKPAAGTDALTGWGGGLLMTIAVGLGVLTVGVGVMFVLAFWLRRGDARVQDKLHAVRTQTFALPPDEPTP